MIDGLKSRHFYLYKYYGKKVLCLHAFNRKNTLYCGYTDDVEKRFQAHLEGRGAKYTRANKPVKIVYTKEFKSKSEAMKEEHRMKELTHKQKLELINC